MSAKQTGRYTAGGFGRAISFSAMLSLLIVCACASLPENVDRTPSYAYTDTDDSRLDNYRPKEITAESGQSGFMLLGNGLDAFVARAGLAQLAERSIDVQYYLFHKDLVGKLFVDQLVKAAKRGVRVRLLVDDMDLGGRDLGAAALDSLPNMEVRIFNPFTRKSNRTLQFLTRYGSVTRRMHNKSFTVDNQATILGGRNIGNEYFDADPDMAFSDLDVLVVGPAAKEVSTSFDLYWNSELSYPASTLKADPPSPEEIKQQIEALDEFIAQQENSPYLDALRTSALADRIRKGNVKYTWGDTMVVYDQPDKLLHDKSETEYHLSPQLSPVMDQVQKELIIFSPYFVPGKEGTAFLTKLSREGVRVRILTNSLSSTDVSVVHAGYSKYRKDLLRAGVDLHEMDKKMSRKEKKEKKGKAGSSKASLHAKSFVFDREEVFVGSLNLDPIALYNNTEIGIVLTSPELASYMSQWFDQYIDEYSFRLELYRDKNGSEKIRWHGIADGKEQVFTSDPYTGFWTRFGVGFLRLLPIESFL